MSRFTESSLICLGIFRIPFPHMASQRIIAVFVILRATVVPVDKTIIEMTMKVTHMLPNIHACLISVAVSDS